jgi:hypothetical protein
MPASPSPFSAVAESRRPSRITFRLERSSKIGDGRKDLSFLHGRMQ